MASWTVRASFNWGSLVGTKAYSLVASLKISFTAGADGRLLAETELQDHKPRILLSLI
jgi:hypothetical protein